MKSEKPDLVVRLKNGTVIAINYKTNTSKKS
jgi:hypothetical protein